MKSIFILAVSLMSIMANAGTVDAITSIVSVGTHYGVNENGSCSVVVKMVNYPENAVTVTAKDSSGEFTKLIKDGTDYQTCRLHTCGGGKHFMQTERVNISDDGISYSEKTIRTDLSGINNDKLYIVVAESIVINRDYNENKVECEIDL